MIILVKLLTWFLLFLDIDFELNKKESQWHLVITVNSLSDPMLHDLWKTRKNSCLLTNNVVICWVQLRSRCRLQERLPGHQQCNGNHSDGFDSFPKTLHLVTTIYSGVVARLLQHGIGRQSFLWSTWILTQQRGKCIKNMFDLRQGRSYFHHGFIHVVWFVCNRWQLLQSSLSEQKITIIVLSAAFS